MLHACSMRNQRRVLHPQAHESQAHAAAGMHPHSPQPQPAHAGAPGGGCCAALLLPAASTRTPSHPLRCSATPHGASSAHRTCAGVSEGSSAAAGPASSASVLKWPTPACVNRGVNRGVKLITWIGYRRKRDVRPACVQNRALGALPHQRPMSVSAVTVGCVAASLRP